MECPNDDLCHVPPAPGVHFCGGVAEMNASTVRPALLVLADGTEFEGESVGYESPNGVSATGEVVFNTALSGYQEVLTDPSYAGQIITFTYPHIGNYGTNPVDEESGGVHCGGLIIRDLARRASNWRSAESLPDYLQRHRLGAITGIDTRRLTRHLRDSGALPGAFGTDEAAVRQAAKAATTTDGIDLVATVTASEAYYASWNDP